MLTLLAEVDISKEWPLAKSFNSLSDIISFVFPKALIVGGVIFFVLIIIAGFGVVSGAGGDDAQAKEQSKNFLTYAVIGLILMFGSYWIMGIISYLTGGSLKGLGF